MSELLILSPEMMPYRVTPAEFEALSVPGIWRARREEIRESARKMMVAELGDNLIRVTQGHPLAEAIHHFSRGVYTRQVHLDTGSVVIGRRHLQEHINVISCGRATVYTEFGIQQIQGPCSFIAPAGTQRLIHVHEHMIWMTVHRTDATTVESAMADLFVDELPLLEVA